jgi:flagellar biosynthesis anti-sigma factor FlgM
MDIRNGVEGLKTLLGVTSTAPAQEQKAKSGLATGNASLEGDRATLSSAGAEVSQTASESGVRGDKVSSVRAAIAAGTYSVPASAVAVKVVDAMLGSGQTSGN